MLLIELYFYFYKINLNYSAVGSWFSEVRASIDVLSESGWDIGNARWGICHLLVCSHITCLKKVVKFQAQVILRRLISSENRMLRPVCCCLLNTHDELTKARNSILILLLHKFCFTELAHVYDIQTLYFTHQRNCLCNCVDKILILHFCILLLSFGQH